MADAFFGLIRWVGTSTLTATAVPGGAASLSATCSIVAAGKVSSSAAGVATLGATAGSILDAKMTYAGAMIALSSATISAKGQLEFDYISIKEIVDEVLLMWGIESTALARDFLKQQAINEINASIQLVSSQAKGLDYLGRATRTYALTQNQSSVTLERDVQNIEGPVRWVRPAVAVEVPSNPLPGPVTWILDLGRMERGYFTLTLTVNSVATAHKVYVKEVDGSDPFNRTDALAPATATPGAQTNDTGRLDQAIDIPGMLSAFEANSQVPAGDLFITGSWPRYKIELTTSHSTTLVASDISSSTLRSEESPLRPISTRGQLESWRQTLGAYQAGRPEYYYVSRTRTGNAEGTAIALEIRPHPDLGVGVAVGSLSADVAIEAPRFTFADYALASRIPLPHRYVESLFLPIVRYRGMVSHYYVGSETASASIQSNYQAALVQFGLVDPQISEAEEVAVPA